MDVVDILLCVWVSNLALLAFQFGFPTKAPPRDAPEWRRGTNQERAIEIPIIDASQSQVHTKHLAPSNMGASPSHP